MKKLILTLIVVLGVGMGASYAQDYAGAMSSSPSKKSSVMTSFDMAQIRAHEIEKICGIKDRATLSEVIGACKEYYDAMNTEEVTALSKKARKLDDKMSKSIKKALNSQQKDAYEAWQVTRRL